MTIVKDKSCIKYFVLSCVVLLCLYSSFLSKLFVPIFDNIYYGNLVGMFTAITSGIIWGVEAILIALFCKKFSIEIFTSKQNKGKELKIWRVIVLFVVTILPMLIISACLNWKLKVVYALGERVTLITLLCNLTEMLAYASKMVLIIMFISSIQHGFEIIFKTKYVIPYGAIFALLTFGLIDFFVLSVDFAVFYLLASFLYGIIYLLTDRKFANTWILCYLIYLL